MTIKDFVNMICSERHMTKVELANQFGISKQQMNTVLSRDNGMGMKVESLVNWLDRIDYQLVVIPMSVGNEAVIDGEDESYLFEDD